MRYSKKFSLFVFSIVLVFLVVLLTSSSSASYIVSKRAIDNTDVMIHYIDPTLPSYDLQTRRISQEGAPVSLYDNMELPYQSLIVNLRFSHVTSANVSYKISYFTIETNETTGTLNYLLNENLTRSVHIDNFVAEDVFDLRVDIERTLVIIEYLDVSFRFYHTTDDAFLATWYSNMSMTFKIITHVAVAVIVGAIAIRFAANLVKRAGYFDFKGDILFGLLFAFTLGLLIYMTVWKYVSLKWLVYTIPWYVFYIIEFIFLLQYTINKNNPDKLLINLSCKINEAGAITGDDRPLLFSSDSNLSVFNAKGFFPSLARYEKVSTANTLQFGKFTSGSDIVKELTFKTDPSSIDIAVQNSKKSILKLKYPVRKFIWIKTLDEEGEHIVIYKKVKEFERDVGINFKWFFKHECPKETEEKTFGEIVGSDYQVVPWSFNFKLVYCFPVFAALVAAIVFQWFVFSPTALSYTGFVKAAGWIIFGRSIFFALGKQVTPAVLQVEIEDIEVEKKFQKAIQRLMNTHDLDVAAPYMNFIYKYSKESSELRTKLFKSVAEMDSKSDDKAFALVKLIIKEFFLAKSANVSLSDEIINILASEQKDKEVNDE